MRVMPKRFTFALVALLLAAPAAARAQTDEHKFEVGAVFTAVGAESLDGAAKGLGARFAYNLNEHFAVDAETAFFPSDEFGNNLVGQNAQGFVGLKAGARSKYVGLFAKARPGVMFVGNSAAGFDCDRGAGFNVCRREQNHLALDAGVVAEFYPSSRTIVRLDLGDTIVRFRRAGRNVFTGEQSGSADITHNFQASVGFGYRF
jgi:Outer membrane protein beta-barrel domain